MCMHESGMVLVPLSAGTIGGGIIAEPYSRTTPDVYFAKGKTENQAQGDFSVDAPCTRLTKYRETAEHEEGKVTDPMHLSTQSLNL